jgi:dihydrolipoamide dehydrogenase
MKRKQIIVKKLVTGVESLLKANRVRVHKGFASLKDGRTIEVAGASPLTLQADAIILSPGSGPMKLKIPGADLPGVIDSTGALSLPAIPKSLVIIGGGAIGVEFAAMYRSFGTEVTIVEAKPEILPMIDSEIAVLVRAELRRQGIRLLTGACLTGIEKSGNGLSAKVAAAGSQHSIEAEYVLICVGRSPRTADIGLEQAGVRTERGAVMVDPYFQTTAKGIYAIGDCNGQIMLAHAASAQGVAAVEHALGHKPAYYAGTVPSCIYSDPEVAGVGLTEEQAKAQGLSYKTGIFPLAGNGKTLIENGGTGMIKIICGGKHCEILGVHIFGPRATDLIAEAALAIRLEATVDELISTVHAHPTVSEAMAEAALAVSGSSIHWPPSRR